MKRDFNVGVIVDRLGHVKARISTLNEEADALKAVLIEQASAPLPIERLFSGAEYRACVSFTNRPCTDWREVQSRLIKAGVDPAIIERAVKQSTKLAEGVPVVRVSARSTP